MPVYTIQAPDGKTYDIEGPEGATADQLGAFIQAQAAPVEPLGKRVNREIADIPRQLGLTARYGLEGIGAIPEMFGNALEGAGVKGAGGNAGKTVANWLSLPQPENATEKIVAEGSKLLTPAAGFVKAGEGLSRLGGVAGNVGKTLAANPAAQLQSAAGAGLLGGAIKETGGNEGAQFAGAVAGGIASPLAFSVAKTLPGAALNAAKRVVAEVAPNAVQQEPQQINVVINSALKNSGMTLDQLPSNIQSAIRNDVAEAMKQGGALDTAALQRLVDYRLVGATPRAANLTLDPVALTQQKNLAKIGANSKDPSAQLLARAENENNSTLIRNLNELGAADAPDAIGAAQRIMGELQAKNAAAKGKIDGLYSAARNTQGRSASLDPAHFTNTANDSLDSALLGAKLPSDVRSHLNRIAKGEMPLTVDVAEQLKTSMAGLQRASSDAAERMALGKVREALDNTPLMGNQGQEAIDAFNRARRVNAAWMKVVDRTPALQAVRDGMEPDKFVSSFIIGNGNSASVMSVAQLKHLTKSNDEATTAIRGQLAAHLKGKALGGAADEVGNFSQSAYNKALKDIGERKLGLFFNQDELAQLKAVGRVASYEQAQPRGSAVNNSNTAPTMIGNLLDRLGNSPLLSKIPLGNILAEPAQNISVGLKSRAAANVPAALMRPYKKPAVGVLVSPTVGLLGAE